MSMQPSTLMSALPLGVGINSSFAGSTTQINNAFTFGSAGISIGFPLFTLATTTLTNLAFYITAVTGTPTFTLELRTRTGSAIGSVVTNGTTTVTSLVANQWIEATWSTPPTITAAQDYIVIVYNSSGAPASDHATVQHRGCLGIPNATYAINAACPYTTTNGWSTITATNSRNAAFVATYGNGTVEGSPYITSSSNYTNDTNERGIYVPAFDVDMSLFAVVTDANNPAAGVVLKVYNATTNPGGTTLRTATQIAGFNHILLEPVTLAKDVNHIIAYDPSSNSTAPSYCAIPDSARYASLLACKHNGMYSVVESGGAWVATESRLPHMRLLFGNPTSTAGGSSVIVIDDD